MAYGARLESVWGCKPPEGSNPSFSARQKRLAMTTGRGMGFWSQRKICPACGTAVPQDKRGRVPCQHRGLSSVPCPGGLVPWADIPYPDDKAVRAWSAVRPLRIH